MSAPPRWAVPADGADVRAAARARLRALGRPVVPPAFDRPCGAPKGCGICSNVQVTLRRIRREAA